MTMEKRTNLVRAAMTLLLAMLFPLWGTVGLLWADNVTASQARQQAQAFLNSRIATGNGPRHAPGTTPQLMQEQMVSGLYVFNVNNDGGFIIVSNDDVATPILGYSDSGTLDPNNMPDNMRAWLQGYADEIAWAKEHHIAKVDASSTPRINRAPKAPIGPLLSTTWNQDEPYNNMTPYYGISDGQYVYSTTGGTGYSHCATGCVATAMAQVMNYHEWPKAKTAAIPEYKWENASPDEQHKVYLPELTSTTFDWENMRDSYKNGYNSAQATAVATLMQYCGWSVSMNYGPSSGSNTDKVATALKEYFDYDATTTFVDRSQYSYVNWIELIYHELAERRPVVYGGQSSGGGHEFVCDGYQGEDYFHINWGWGGKSDDYFKLSALNPNEQGIGGSSSNDGFHYGQDAIIGIKKNGAEGIVLDVSPNNYHLKMNSISLSKSSVAIGETVDVTFNITNTKINDDTDEYDGDIWIYVQGIGLMTGKTFVIGAGETKDCVVPFTPSGYTGTFEITGLIPNSNGNYSYMENSQTVSLNVTAGSGANNNVELTLSDPIVENTVLNEPLTEYNGFNIYDLYGTNFNATVTVTNSTGTNYDGTFRWVLIPAGSSAYIQNVDIKVPAHSSIEVPISVSGLDYNTSYYVLKTSYVKGNSYSWIENGYYIPRAAIMQYTADGTSSVVIPSGSEFDAATKAPTALVVDVSGTGVTSITPNTKPNTLYIYSGTTPPSGLEGKNIVKNNNGSYTADNITLTDDNDFYSPVDITASNIVFNYEFTTGADGSKGWNTIMLPFNVTSVTANDAEIDWFHNKDDKGKNFWLKEFVNDEANKVYFNFANEMNANTPYIVAFPGNKWGEDWDMSNKDIKFIGSGAISKSGTMTSVTASNFRFIGNTVQDDTENIYCLNDDGNAFVLKETGGSGPFRAYFKPGIFDRTLTSLAIGSGTGTTTDIDAMFLNNAPSATNVYDLQGRRVTQPTKGLYIVNGKKVIVK